MKRLTIGILLAVLLLLPVRGNAHGHGPHHHHYDYGYEDSFLPRDYLYGFMPYLIYTGSFFLRTPPGSGQARWGSVHTVEVGTHLHLIPWLFAGIGVGYEYNRFADVFHHATFLSEHLGFNITFGETGSYLRLYGGPQQLFVLGGNGEGYGRYVHYYHWGGIVNFGGYGIGIQFRYPSARNANLGDYPTGLITSLSIVIGF